MDIFESKELQPMLLKGDVQPFDDPEFIFELKLDGERCLAYLDEHETVLINRNGKRLDGLFPELDSLNKQINQRCILDGELVVMNSGRPDFDKIRRRSAMKDKRSISRAAREQPVEFVAYDILYLGQENLMGLPLLERKERLEHNVEQGGGLTISRFIVEQGKAFFHLIVEQNLEGIVGKRANSLYFPGKRSPDWVKIKHLLDDDFIVCGYIRKEHTIISLVLGQYDDSYIVYKGHATLSLSNPDFTVIASQPVVETYPFPMPPPRGNEHAVWIKPDLVCTVTFLEYTSGGGIRHPVYKGLRSSRRSIP